MRRFVALLGIATALAAAPGRPARPQLRVPVWGDNGLALKDFHATVDGQEAPLAGLRTPADDLIVLLVLDLVGDLALVEAAKQAVIEQVNRLPANAWVSLLRAQDGLRVLLDPTADREAVAKAVRELNVSGKAGLLDTVESVARVGDAMLAKSAVRLAVLYITDSNVYNYRDDFTNPVINSSDYRDVSRHFPEGLIKERMSRVEDSLAALQPPLFVVHLDYRSDRLNEAYQGGLLKMAAVTGGAGMFCRSLADVGPVIGKAFESIRSHYSLVLRLPEKPARNLQIRIDSGDRSLNYRSRFLRKEK